MYKVCPLCASSVEVDHEDYVFCKNPSCFFHETGMPLEDWQKRLMPPAIRKARKALLENGSEVSMVILNELEALYEE